MTPRHFIQKNFLAAFCFLSFSAAVVAGPALPLSPAYSAGPSYSISEKLMKSFQKTFPDAEQVKWVEQENQYTVNFRQNGNLTRVVYDKDGNFLSSLRYYKEKGLPVSILCRLQKKYADKKVFGVTELTTENSVEYYIKLEDDNNWITVRSTVDGNLQVVEKYKKA